MRITAFFVAMEAHPTSRGYLDIVGMGLNAMLAGVDVLIAPVIEFEADPFDAYAEHETTLRLFNADGQVVSESPPRVWQIRPDPSRAGHRRHYILPVQMHLHSLPVGDYQLRVFVDGDEMAERPLYLLESV